MTIQEIVRQRMAQDPELTRLRKKIEGGKASYADTAAYSHRAGKLLGEIFSQALPEIPMAEREALCVELLHDRYMDINGLVDTVQRYMDKALGIHIAPQHAPFDSERGHQIGSSLRDPNKTIAVLQRRAGAASETATKAMHDDRMQTEAAFRHRAGLDCHITRAAVGGCCGWCTKVAGRYIYGEEPDNIYRRHDNCDCTVTFENGRKRQDVWSKRTWEVPDGDAGAGAPIKLTAEQAQKLQAQHQVLTLQGRRDIIAGRGSGTGYAADAHSFEKIGDIDPADQKAIASQLAEFERKYRNSDIEHCRVITASGEVYDVHGSRYTVDTTLLGDRMRGSTNEHNHVVGESQYSFSWDDLREGARDGSAIMIAFDERCRYRISFHGRSISYDELYDAYRIAVNEVDEVNFNSYLRNKTKQITDEDYQHEVIKRTCEKVGVQYERQPKT